MTKIKSQKLNGSLKTNVILAKPKRKRISTEQLDFLTELFKKTTSPNHALREKLTNQLNMTNREIQVWFQNRRAKINRLGSQQKNLQHTSDRAEKNSKFYYWHHESSFLTSSSTSSSVSPLQTPCEDNFKQGYNPIDILATAAVYVQRWEEEKKQQSKREHWRPWN
ncbi:homeobox domain-containing protein [Sporodiniella umbellata]|nr:homeobox domain-containing protein [Sporodiniella umbellata]